MFSDDYATDVTATSAKVEVNGTVKDVDGDGKDDKFIINQADLAKYFVVTGEIDNHDITVKFTNVRRDDKTTGDVKIVNSSDVANNVATVSDNGGTYLDLNDNLTVLDWDTYTGLNVTVAATLYVNGHERNSLDLTLYTADPLTLKAAKDVTENDGYYEYTVAREQFKDGEAYVHDAVQVISAITNADVLGHTKNLEKDDDVIATIYGGSVVAEQGINLVYYIDAAGKQITLGTNKYSYNPTTGKITVKADDGTLNRTYYAEFTVTLKSRICSESEKGHVANVRVIFTPAK